MNLNEYDLLWFRMFDIYPLPGVDDSPAKYLWCLLQDKKTKEFILVFKPKYPNGEANIHRYLIKEGVDPFKHAKETIDGAMPQLSKWYSISNDVEKTVPQNMNVVTFLQSTGLFNIYTSKESKSFEGK